MSVKHWVAVGGIVLGVVACAIVVTVSGRMLREALGW